MTDGSHAASPRALLVHSADGAWRHAMRTALRTALDAMGVTVLLSSREAEAAKCLADPRVVMVVVVDDPAIRRTLLSLASSLPVVWSTGSDRPEDVATRVRAELDLLHQAQRGSSA